MAQPVINYFDSEPYLFDIDNDVVQYFTMGECNALAYELYKLMGGTLAIDSDVEWPCKDYMAHAYLIDSNGMCIDIRGRQYREDFDKDWPWLSYTYRFAKLKSYHVEMTTWKNNPHYTRNREAKWWARYIIDTLS